VLGSAWDDVRQVRESDKILAVLESETSRLQNLIHRYINQPSPELFAEILLLREAVLGTLTTRASTDPMLSGSVEELERVTERFLNGFGETARGAGDHFENLRAGGPDPGARHGRALLGHRGRDRPPRCPDLAVARKIPRGAFTGMLSPPMPIIFRMATASAEEARRNTETIEKTIPVMADLADNDLQRLALDRLKERTVALREGFAN